MKIYAIKDRLIDYFMQPFFGPDDKNVFASVARLVNEGELTSDIAQAPHHFEIWRLGEINEEGHIEAKREFLADCSSLIRTGIRQRGVPGGQEAARPEGGRTGAPVGDREAAGPEGAPIQETAPSAPGDAQEAHPGPGRSHPIPRSRGNY